MEWHFLYWSALRISASMLLCTVQHCEPCHLRFLSRSLAVLNFHNLSEVWTCISWSFAWSSYHESCHSGHMGIYSLKLSNPKLFLFLDILSRHSWSYCNALNRLNLQVCNHWHKMLVKNLRLQAFNVDSMVAHSLPQSLVIVSPT